MELENNNLPKKNHQFSIQSNHLQKHRLTRSKNGGKVEEERSAVSFEEVVQRKDDIVIVGHFGSSLDSQPPKTTEIVLAKTVLSSPI